MTKYRVMAWLWVSVLLLTGGLGGLVISRVGWALAMALAMYGGDTDPGRPDLPYPWLVFGIALLMGVGGLAWGFRGRDRQREGQPSPPLVEVLAPVVLAYAGGLLAILLPFFQIYRLWAALG